MAERLPTTTELKSAFGGKGVVGQTRTVFQALRDEEAAGPQPARRAGAGQLLLPVEPAGRL